MGTRHSPAGTAAPTPACGQSPHGPWARRARTAHRSHSGALGVCQLHTTRVCAYVNTGTLGSMTI
eukprot:10618080-Alexandrium_andersonii.AAC.1